MAPSRSFSNVKNVSRKLFYKYDSNDKQNNSMMVCSKEYYENAKQEHAAKDSRVDWTNIR